MNETLYIAGMILVVFSAVIIAAGIRQIIEKLRK